VPSRHAPGPRTEASPRRPDRAVGRAVPRRAKVGSLATNSRNASRQPVTPSSNDCARPSARSARRRSCATRRRPCGCRGPWCPGSRFAP
jgi:hypothetical protein